MALSTRIKGAVNDLLRPLNLSIETLTARKIEAERIDRLIGSGHFEAPAYALSPGMEAFDPAYLASLYRTYEANIRRLRSSGGDVGYVYEDNTFFPSPDLEVLYCMVRGLAPARIVEVGCGNSTRISRQAILDGKLETRLTAIDPWPRLDIAAFVDRFIQKRIEETPAEVFADLGPGDILFIDSSHELKVGNDVARLFCEIIPALKPGVVIHVHDVFLPFDYAREKLADMAPWGEQYVLHALLQAGRHEILWPGHYVQRLRPDCRDALPFLSIGSAQSFWFKVG